MLSNEAKLSNVTHIPEWRVKDMEYGQKIRALRHLLSEALANYNAVKEEDEVQARDEAEHFIQDSLYGEDYAKLLEILND